MSLDEINRKLDRIEMEIAELASMFATLVGLLIKEGKLDEGECNE